MLKVKFRQRNICFLHGAMPARLFMEGVPVFMNDAAYEQIYENTSSYIGRDHTNKDDMSIYSKETHLTASWWYGCLGVYLDNMPGTYA